MKFCGFFGGCLSLPPQWSLFHQELFEAEKQRLLKKEQESKELIIKLTKKLKVSLVRLISKCANSVAENNLTTFSPFQIQEKKNKDNSAVAIELRKHYEQARQKADKLNKDKSHMETQMKKLLS